MYKNCKYLKKKINGEIWCTYNKEKVSKKLCANCSINNKYISAKKLQSSADNIADKKYTTFNKNKKHKLTIATSITKEVKLIVWERDNHECIFCHKKVPWTCANSHYVKRSQNGLGIEQNIMTNCNRCHELYEESKYREQMKIYARNYFISKYINWNEEMLTYKKYNFN